ncbi:hypothetical protein [Alteribacillus sp. HJP-4]|uniref:hypothetical protein n=1 Tax=Alteribacillus sp. HJP-4 TaxID=2775394 RepID=UPI0035CCFCF2
MKQVTFSGGKATAENPAGSKQPEEVKALPAKKRSPEANRMINRKYMLLLLFSVAVWTYEIHSTIYILEILVP